jgi:signal transduction histidine kinase
MTAQPMKMPAASTPEKPRETNPAPAVSAEANPDKMPVEVNRRLRSLAHDLSNSIETIMQACYLLGQAPLDDTNKKWLSLVDQAARDAARINRDIREILRGQSS